MANAAGYSLGDISSLLFSADASAAPQSKKKNQAAPPALANPFAAHAKTSDNATAFAETARAQVAAGVRRKDAGEEKLQAAEAMGATDISDPVGVLLVPQDGTSHPVPTSNPQSALDAASSAYAGMYSTCCSGATRRRRSRPRPQPLQTWGARHGPAAAVAAVLLCLSFFARIASAQQTPCSSAWSTAALSVARGGLAATSLPNQGLAIFAGGQGL
jgi:hypothetical protein